ncbi:hypothetical protein B0H13DRAFT_2329808 [Mycena leptocephala]|nr:hypothetical protein B0H13DRAFT_2329808 [Mycena leptocephala]
MNTLDDEARIYLQELFKTPYSSPLPSTAQYSPNHRDSVERQTAQSRYRPYQNTHITGNSCMTGKVGHPSPRVGSLGRLPHTRARVPLPTPYRSSSRPPKAEFNPRVTPTSAAPSSQSTSAKPKPDRPSIDSASLERWFLTGVYADA